MSSRLTPFEQMEAMFDQMRRAAFEAWDEPMRLEPRPRLAFDDGSTRDVGVTVEESEDGYVVMADLPGFDSEEIDLTFDDGVLTITGTHEMSEEDSYRQRSVHESVRVPGAVEIADATATYRNGVLEVMLPVGDDDGTRIDIE